MFALMKHREVSGFDDRLRDASAVTAELMSEILAETGGRFASAARTDITARIECLIRSGAWTDAALALLDLALPKWQLRRLAYDGGEWHCALSRQRDLPDWLDQPVEAHHVDMALAILSAFVDAQRTAAPSSRTSVPLVAREASPLYEPVLADNYA